VSSCGATIAGGETEGAVSGSGGEFVFEVTQEMADCDVSAGFTFCSPPLLAVTFLNDLTDISGNDLVVVHTGGISADIGPEGVHFSANGDYVAVQNFDYASDTEFSISLWFTKVNPRNSNCTLLLAELISCRWWSRKNAPPVCATVSTSTSSQTMQPPTRPCGPRRTSTSTWVRTALRSHGSTPHPSVSLRFDMPC
jgi:hypothetical protein